MHAVHEVSPLKDLYFAFSIELVFLGICTVFVGLGVSEIRRRGQYSKNVPLIFLGVALAALSLYATQLLIQG